MEPRPIAPVVDHRSASDAEREAVKAKRRELKLRRQAEAARPPRPVARDRHHH